MAIAEKFLEVAPTEDEQLGAYQAIADAMPRRPIIVRLLDIGGDKPAPYVRIAPEKERGAESGEAIAALSRLRGPRHLRWQRCGA